MNLKKPKYLFILIPIVWIFFNGLTFLLSPGVYGVKRVSEATPLRQVLSQQLVTEEALQNGSFKHEDLRQFESLRGVNCWTSYSDIGAREPSQDYINGAIYGISCRLPRVWSENAGVWNLIDPARVRVTFHFSPSDTLVQFDIGLLNYFGGLYY